MRPQVLLYQISPTETRVLVDAPMEIGANPDALHKYLLETVEPQVRVGTPAWDACSLLRTGCLEGGRGTARESYCLFRWGRRCARGGGGVTLLLFHHTRVSVKARKTVGGAGGWLGTGHWASTNVPSEGGGKGGRSPLLVGPSEGARCVRAIRTPWPVRR